MNPENNANSAALYNTTMSTQAGAFDNPFYNFLSPAYSMEAVHLKQHKSTTSSSYYPEHPTAAPQPIVPNVAPPPPLGSTSSFPPPVQSSYSQPPLVFQAPQPTAPMLPPSLTGALNMPNRFDIPKNAPQSMLPPVPPPKSPSTATLGMPPAFERPRQPAIAPTSTHHRIMRAPSPPSPGGGYGGLTIHSSTLDDANGDWAASTPSGRGLVGLKNLGNTCYMNSMLQCLIATRPVVSIFFSRFY